jgi:hypothetical protein
MEDAKTRKKSIFRRWWFWVLIAIIIIAAISNGSGKKTANSPAKTNNTAPAKSEPASKITYDNFLKIKMGEKLTELEALIGKGSEESSSEISGIKTVIYTWKGPGISNMNVTIQNNIVIGKAQAGLQQMDAKITLDKYNQVKEGMTYDKVKSILGEGQLISETSIMNIESAMYEWINKDGSNMNGTFTGGKLNMKSQFNLK